jgi:hypothetical protein
MGKTEGENEEHQRFNSRQELESLIIEKHVQEKNNCLEIKKSNKH